MCLFAPPIVVLDNELVFGRSEFAGSLLLATLPNEVQFTLVSLDMRAQWGRHL